MSYENDQPYSYIGYVKTEYEDTANKCSNLSPLGRVAVFGFSTDQHFSRHINPSRYPAIKRGLRTLSKLSSQIPMDFIAFGGDATDCNALSEILDDVNTLQSFTYDANCPVISMTGNHDSYQNNNNMTGKMVFNSYIKKNTYHKYWDEWDSTHASGVIDSEGLQTRFIFLDDTTRGEAYTLEQMRAKLGDMMDSRPQGYKMVVFSHHPMRTWPSPTYFVGGNLCYGTLQNHADGDAICAINGHGHGDDSRYSSGILYIETQKAYPDTTSMLVDTVNETAFDVFTIDYDNSIVYAIRYGYGGDRKWHYAPVELNVNDTHTFTPTLTGTLTWSVDEYYVDADHRNDVATVEDGVITVIGTGQSLVKAVDEEGNLEAWAISVT